MRTFNEKVKQFVENNFEKIVKIFLSRKKCQISGVLSQIRFFYFFLFLPIRIANTIRKPAKT